MDLKCEVNRKILNMQDPPIGDELISKIARTHKKLKELYKIVDDKECRKSVGSIIYRENCADKNTL